MSSEHTYRYKHLGQVHNTKSAAQIVPLILSKYQPKSVIDLGCGLGSWLAVFKDHGIDKILGIEGNAINEDELLISKAELKYHKLTKPYTSYQRYDLCICLEVAEHLPKDSAETIVSSLCSLSDQIIFSAAIPSQGGQNHLNEQPPKYWAKKFRKHGFQFYDIFRDTIWDMHDVQWWYRQNIFWVSKDPTKVKGLKNIEPSCAQRIHPELEKLIKERKENSSIISKILKRFK